MCSVSTLDALLSDSVSSVRVPAGRLPFALKDDVKAELDRLGAMGVMANVYEPTEWISALVVEKKKNGKLHLCLDTRPLNKALRRSIYPVPVVDDLLPRLTKAKIFTVCDARNEY